MPGWNERHQENRNLKRKREGRRDVKPSCSGPPMSTETKDMLRVWMVESPSTTIHDIRILCSQRNISHPAEQIAKWISNKRTSIANKEEEEKLREKRRQYTPRQYTPFAKEQKKNDRKNYARQPTPSSAGPAIVVEDKLILEQYFCNISRLPGLVECRELIARNQWTDLYSGYQIQKWFKNRRRREVKTGGREVEIGKLQRIITTNQQNKYRNEYRETSKLFLEPVQSSLVPDSIDPLSFDEPTLKMSDMHMPTMPSVEDEGVVDDNIFDNLEDIEDVDLLFGGL